MSKKTYRQRAEGDADPKVTSVQDMYLSPKRQCTAHSKASGKQCQRYAMRGLRVCVVHGGATRQAKAKAAERIRQASGFAADLLVELMASPEVDIKVRTQIAQDLLNRSGVNAAQVLQLEKGKSWEEVIDGLVEVPDEGDEQPALPASPEVIVDAEVIEDDSWMEDADRERRRRQKSNAVPMTEDDTVRLREQRDRVNRAAGSRAELEAEERRALAAVAGDTHADKPGVTRGREAYLAALDSGATQAEAEAAARYAAERTPGASPRRARVTEATFSSPPPRKRRR